MIFEQDNLVFQVLDIISIDEMMSKTVNLSRNFDALSFRFHADTTLECREKVTVLTDNSLAYIPSNTSYTRTTSRDHMIVIHLKVLNYSSTTIEACYPTKPEVLAELFQEAYKCWNSKDVSYRHETSAILNRIFAEIYKDNCYAKENASKIGDAVKYINKYIFSPELSLAEAAKLAFISDTYFRKLFKREFGVSPKEYVIEKRIKYAASLIIAGDCSLKEVATFSGYNDYKHFSVEFKRVTGKSPSEYNYNYYLMTVGNS